MIEDLTINYVCNGIKTTLTIEDDHYDNMPYKLADMFAKVIRESDANPQIVIENLKNALNMIDIPPRLNGVGVCQTSKEQKK